MPTNYDPRNGDGNPTDDYQGSGQQYVTYNYNGITSRWNQTARQTTAPQPNYAAIAQAAGLQRATVYRPTADQWERQSKQWNTAFRLGLFGLPKEWADSPSLADRLARDEGAAIEKGIIDQRGNAVPDMLGFSERAYWESNGEQDFVPLSTDDHTVTSNVNLAPYRIDPTQGPDEITGWLALHAPAVFQSLIENGASAVDVTNVRNVLVAKQATDAAMAYATGGMPEASLQVLNALPTRTRLIAAALMYDASEKADAKWQKDLADFRAEQAKNRDVAADKVQGTRIDPVTGQVLTPTVDAGGTVVNQNVKQETDDAGLNPFSYLSATVLQILDVMLVGVETMTHAARAGTLGSAIFWGQKDGTETVSEFGGPTENWDGLNILGRVGALWNASDEGFISQESAQRIKDEFGEKNFEVMYAYYKATQENDEEAMPRFFQSIADDPEARLLITSALRGGNMEGDDLRGADLFVEIAAADQGNLGAIIASGWGLEPGSNPYSVSRDSINVASWFLLDPLLYAGKVGKAYRLARYGLAGMMERYGGSVSEVIVKNGRVGAIYDGFGASAKRISEASGPERDRLMKIHNRQYTRRESAYFGPEHTDLALKEGLFTKEQWAEFYKRIDDAGKITEGKVVSIPRSPWLKGDKARKNAGKTKETKQTKTADEVTPPGQAYTPAQYWMSQVTRGAKRDMYVPHASRASMWRRSLFEDMTLGMGGGPSALAAALTEHLGQEFYALSREQQIDAFAKAMEDPKFATMLGARLSDFQAISEGGKRTWLARNVFDPLLGAPGSDRKFTLGWRTKVDETGRRVNKKGWARKRAWNSDTSWDESFKGVMGQYRRLLTALPDVRRGVATNTAKDADNVYKMAIAAGVGEDGAQMIKSFWIEAGEGQRQLALTGLVRTFIRASGISAVDEKAERELLAMMSGIREGEAYAARHVDRLGGVIEDIGRAAGRERGRMLAEAEARVNPFQAELDAAQAAVDGAKAVSLKGEGFDLERSVAAISGASGRDAQADVLVFNLRRSENAGVPTYARGSTDGYADGLGVDPSDVVAVWEPSDPAVEMLEAAGRPGFVYVELNGSPEAASVFRDAIAEAQQAHKFGSSVTVKSLEEYSDGTYRFFMNSNGTAGFAITKGDVVSVFSTPGEASGAVDEMMRLAIQNGGKTADSVDTVLPKLYKRHGFKEYKRDKWNEDYKPEGWDKQVYAKFNNGEPDYLYYRYDKNYVPGDKAQQKLTREELIQKRNDLKRKAREWDRQNKASVPSVDEIARGLTEEAKKPGGLLANRVEAGRMANGNVGGVYPAQMAPAMWVPNFQALDRYAARTSILNSFLFNSNLGSTVTNLWVLGTLAGPRFQLRNGLEDGLMYAMTRGKLSSWVRGRRVDQAVTQASARQSEQYAAARFAYEKAVGESARAERQLAQALIDEEAFNAVKAAEAEAKKELENVEKILGDKSGKLGVVRTPIVRLSEWASWDKAGNERDTILGRIARQLVPTTSAFERQQAALGGREAVVELAAKAIVRQKLAASNGRFSIFGKKMRRAKSIDELSEADRKVLAWELSLLRSEYGYQFKEEAAETARHITDSTLPVAGDLPDMTYLDGALYRAIYPSTSYETTLAKGLKLSDTNARSFLHVLEMMTDRTSLTQLAMYHLPSYWGAVNAAGGKNRALMDKIISDIIIDGKKSGDWAFLVERMRISASNPARTPEVVIEEMLSDMVGNMTTRGGKFNQELWAALRHEDKNGKPFFAVQHGDKEITVEQLIEGKFDHPEAILVRRGEPVWVPADVNKEFGSKAWEMMGRSLARFTRNPIWTGEYFEARKALSAFEERLAKVLGPERADKMVTDAAAERAYNITMAYVDNPAIRTNLAWQVRNVARYYRAQEDFARRMLRVTKNEPMGIWKAVLAWNATMDLGFVHEDQYGQPYFIYPLTAPAMATVNNIMNGLGITTSKFEAAPMAFGGRVQWLSPSLDPGQWLPSASSPWSSLMLEPLLRHMPVAQDFFRWVEQQAFGEIAADVAMDTNAEGVADSAGSVAYSLLPPFAKKMWGAIQSFISNDAPGTYGYRMTMQTMLAMGAAGQVPTPDEWRNPGTRREFLDNLQMRTVEVSVLSAMFGLTAPSSPQYMPDYVSEAARAAGYENLSPAFRDMLVGSKDAYGDTRPWMELYMDWIADHPSDGIFLERMYESSDAGFVAATMTNVDFIKGHQDLWKEAPQGVALFLPDQEMIGRSREAFSQMKRYNTVQWRSVEDYASSIIGVEGKFAWDYAEIMYQRDIAGKAKYLADGSINPEWRAADEARQVARNMIRNDYEGIDAIMWGGGSKQASEYGETADQIVTAVRALADSNDKAALVAPLIDVFQEARADMRAVDQRQLPADVNPDERGQWVHESWDATVQKWLENVGDGLTTRQKEFIVYNLTRAIPTSGSWEPIEVN